MSKDTSGRYGSGQVDLEALKGPPDLGQQSATRTVSMSSQHQLRKPWIDAGYPKLCEDIASAENLLLVRRFNKLHARAILQLQDEIVRKEEDLDMIDAHYQEPGSEKNSGTMRQDLSVKRQSIIREVRSMLKEYGT